MQIPLRDIRIDGGTQPRTAIDDSVVSEYMEAMQGGAEFPPVIVYHDGVAYWLADGFHRSHAARRAGIEMMPADVRQGTKRDAILHSVGANTDHGLRRTNADKRQAVMTLLEDEEWSGWTNVAIANQCGVSDMHVYRMRQELSHQQCGSEPPTERTYTTKHGTTATMQTGNIGQGQRVPEPPPQAPDTEPAPRPERRGKAMPYAYEAIASLKRIPVNDGLRDEALNLVADWIETNRSTT